MREDYLEQLDKMFPRGYAIVYTCENNTVRFSHYNPGNVKTIWEFYELAKKINEEEK